MRPKLSEASVVCVGEIRRLLTENPTKYSLGTIAFGLLPLVDRRLGTVARSSYLLLRHIDDVLDGDYHGRHLGTNKPIDYVNSIKEQVVSGQFTGSPPISHLGQQLFNSYTQPGDDPNRLRDILLGSIDSMMIDHTRSQERRALPADELRLQLTEVNATSLRLLLATTRSRLSENDVTDVSYSEGIGNAVGHFLTDWNRGIINIPIEILNAAGLSVLDDAATIMRCPAVRKWFRTELDTCRHNIRIAHKKLLSTREPLTILVASGFVLPAQRLISTSYKQVST